MCFWRFEIKLKFKKKKIWNKAVGEMGGGGGSEILKFEGPLGEKKGQKSNNFNFRIMSTSSF